MEARMAEQDQRFQGEVGWFARAMGNGVDISIVASLQLQLHPPGHWRKVRDHGRQLVAHRLSDLRAVSD